MKKIILEPIFIFLGVLGSLWVDGYREQLNKKEELDNSIITLSNEIRSNINYSKEHISQLKNMLNLTEFLLNNYSTYDVNQVREIHDNSPFVHRFSEKNKVVYVREHSDFTDKKYFYWTNAWEPDDVFFTSLLNSGELLKIKNETLVNEIESIYTKQEERISGTFALRNSIANQMIRWDLKKSIAQKTYKNPLYWSRDNELNVLLKWRKIYIEESITAVKDYIKSLKNVIEIINYDYQSVNDL